MKRVVYAWQEQDKFFLSPFPYGSNKRQPANWYDSSTDLVAEAGRRGVKVQWQLTGNEQQAPDEQ